MGWPDTSALRQTHISPWKDKPFIWSCFHGNCHEGSSSGTKENRDSCETAEDVRTLDYEKCFNWDVYIFFFQRRGFSISILQIYLFVLFFSYFITLKSGWGWYLLWVNISKSWHLNISVTCWKAKHFHELNIDWLWWWVRIHFVRFYIFLYISVPVCVSASTVFLQRLTPICKSMWIKSMDKNKSILELFPPTIWMNIYIQQKTSGKTGREMTLNVSLRAVEQIVLL